MPLERQIVAVILDHPEYHAMLDKPMPDNEAAYFPEMGQTNPFLHMGLHLAVRDQLAVDKPTGIADLHRQLLQKYQDALLVEHLIIDQFAECLWNAQRQHSSPDDVAYLAAIKRLV